MKKIILLALFGQMILSCNSKPSLQKYFVENLENKNFISMDVSPSLLNIEGNSLSSEQKTALKSFEKMNLLAFKVNGKNELEYNAEKLKVDALLKDKKYQQLIKFGSGSSGASISYVGDDDHIEEFIIYANKKENGFAVARILGKDMTPENIMTMLSALQKSNIDLKQFSELQEIMK